jgi:serine protease Do
MFDVHRVASFRGFLACALVAVTAGAAALHADVVTLRSGAVLRGDILKRNDKHVWLDVGPDVLQFKVDDIDSVEIDAPETTVESRSDSLFHTVSNPPELSPKEHAKRIGPAVIKVSTPGGLGSGVIINGEGYAITNAHVVQGETTLRATVWFRQGDGTLLRRIIEDVEIIAVNNHLDLALLKIPHPDDGEFDFAPVEPEESIEVGQIVFAIGNPLGLERTLSQGVISTTQRSFGGLSYVQTDAAINPGNSGGPLFNTKGEVIGITNMGILAGEALGFAIPARYVKDFVRNREAFAFDKDNPNSGHSYHKPPPRKAFETAPQLRDKTSEPADSN